MKLLHLYIEKYKKYEKQHIVFSKDTSSCYQNEIFNSIKVLKLKEAVTYQKGQVVFLILTQNEALSVTLFFDKRRN